MLIVLSPAKTLDFDTPLPPHPASKPVLLSQSVELNQLLRQLSPPQLASLMHISAELAQLNFDRNAAWTLPFTKSNARQALFAFRGDVYVGLEADNFSDDDLAFAQQHLRILSGLYGVLRPLDLMQPYRLEMGTALRNASGKTLYDFWGDTVTLELNKALKAAKSKTLVNLASQEYFGVVRRKVLQAEVVTPNFLDFKNGQYKVISFFAKKARGTMAAWLLQQRISDPAQFIEFAADGYRFSVEDSTASELVFTRKQA